jgi:hypothetical protein
MVHLCLLLNDGKETENDKNTSTQMLSIQSSQVPPSERSKEFIIKEIMYLIHLAA